MLQNDTIIMQTSHKTHTKAMSPYCKSKVQELEASRYNQEKSMPRETCTCKNNPEPLYFKSIKNLFTLYDGLQILVLQNRNILGILGMNLNKRCVVFPFKEKMCHENMQQRNKQIFQNLDLRCFDKKH